MSAPGDAGRSLPAIARDLCGPLRPLPTGMQRAGGPVEAAAVIFDIYGTLLVSAAGEPALGAPRDRGAALAAALAGAGLSGNLRAAGDEGVDRLPAAVAAVHAARRKEGIDHPEVDIRAVWSTIFAELAGAGLLDRVPGPAAVERIAVAFECAVNPTWPMPGMVDVLGEFRRRGTALGIVSNAQFYTPPVVAAVTGRTFRDLGFDPALTALSWRHRVAKPSMRLFAPVLRELEARGIPPERALYVGNDMLNDAWTAKQCGCRAALFAGDRRSLRLREDDPRCSSLRPDLVITALPQLLDGVGPR